MTQYHELPPMRKDGELSVRDKSVEVRPGVYVAKMGALPIRLGAHVVAAEQLDQPDATPVLPLAKEYEQ